LLGQNDSLGWKRFVAGKRREMRRFIQKDRTYVRPVLRLTPARKAETRTASKAKWVRRPSWGGGVVSLGVDWILGFGRGLFTTMIDLL
jgi:hypothetical protein